MVLIPFYHVRTATSLLLSLVAFFASFYLCIIQLPRADGSPGYIIYGYFVICSKGCYILLQFCRCTMLLQTVTKCWSVLSIMVDKDITTIKLPRLPAVYMRQVVTTTDYQCCLPEPWLDSCDLILRLFNTNNLHSVFRF